MVAKISFIFLIISVAVSQGNDEIVRPTIESLYAEEDKTGDDRIMIDDMVLTQEQYQLRYGKRSKRIAQRLPSYHWPNNVIPYKMDSILYTADQKSKILEAMKEWQDKTCLTFKPNCDINQPCLKFKNAENSGCHAFVGKSVLLQEQSINLAKKCFHKSVILHELGHVIGLFHDQCRPDRDEYVTVHDDNIVNSKKINFNKETWETVDNFTVPYDYYSIMHYRSNTFSKNGKPTITTKGGKYDNIIGTLDTLSFGNLKTVNIMYKCAPFCGKKCPGDGFLDKNCNCVCQGDQPEKTPTKSCNSGAIPYTTARPPQTTPAPDWCRDNTNNYDGYCLDEVVKGNCDYESNNYARNVMWCRRTCKLCHHCVDTLTDCKERERNGKCSSDADTKIYCKKACGLCNLPCDDQKIYCAALGGWCQHNRYKKSTRFIAACPKTCGYCPGVPYIPSSKPAAAWCEDTNTNPEHDCKVYAEKNYCFLNYYFMVNNCKKSCNFCHICLDHDSSCEKVTKGTCTKGSFESAYCRKSCGLCTKEDCGDTWDYCDNIRGWCFHKNYKNMMFFYCTKTCGYCSDDPTNRVTPKPASSPPLWCTDDATEPNCKRYAEDGYCAERNYNYMKKKCPRTCNICLCQDNPRVSCQNYKNVGHCTISRDYMNANCKKTCGFCS